MTEVVALAAPRVHFAGGARPEAATHVRLEEFDGPLALLLSLIEARRLDVLTVPLGALAGAYLDALAALDADRLTNVSSFVAVASQLILIKSRALLPRRGEPVAGAPVDEGVDPEEELRARLLEYRAYRDGGAALAAEALRRIGLFRREPGAAQAAAISGSRPGPLAPLDPASLADSIARLLAIIPPPAPPPEVLGRTITITERAAVIRRALAGAPTIVLQEILRGVRDKVVVAITFLALLELMKRREVVVEQAEPWGPIVARSTTPEERGGHSIDETPIDESLESFA